MVPPPPCGERKHHILFPLVIYVERGGRNGAKGTSVVSLRLIACFSRDIKRQGETRKSTYVISYICLENMFPFEKDQEVMTF